jgi:hypothetical protein
MLPNKRELPIGIQDFEGLRTDGYLYVDKTAYIYRMVSKGKPYFLSRPRRFGKSLLLSTLKAYFLGKKELFEGLAIAELEKEWMEYPVFYMDMNVADYTGVDILEAVLDSRLRSLEEKWGRAPEDKLLSIRFEYLLQQACLHTG